MAKMTKTEVVELAKAKAMKNTDVTAMTVAELEQLGYEQRRQQAQDSAKHAAESYGAGLDQRYAGEFAPAYEQAVLNIWGTKLKQLQNARHAWKVASGSMTHAQAVAQLQTLVKGCNVRGLREGYGSTTFEVERAWGVGATLYVRLDMDYDNKTENPDNPAQCAYRYTVRTELSWSGTTRSIAESVASIKLYQELVDIAAEIEATLGRERIVHVRGVEETATEPATV